MRLPPFPGGGGLGWADFARGIIDLFRQKLDRPFWLWSAATADLPTDASLGANEGAAAYDSTEKGITYHNGSGWRVTVSYDAGDPATLDLTGKKLKYADSRQTGTKIARFENSGAAAATGSTGIGIELAGATGGESYIQSVDRTSSPAFAPLNIAGSVINFQQGGTTTLKLESHYGDFADDAAAAAGNVPVKGIYHTGSVLKVRVA